MVSGGLVDAVLGVVAEGNGEAVGAVIGVGLADGFSSVSRVSLSPNVPSSPSRDIKQEAGGPVPTNVAYLEVENDVVTYLEVENDVGLYDTPYDGGFVVVKTVKKNDVGLYDTPTDGGIVVVKTLKTIAHFRVALCLSIKARPGAQPFI